MAIVDWRAMDRKAFWLRVFHFVFGERPVQTQRDCCWSVTGEAHAPNCGMA